jgi:molybdopterin converting factor small subunit
MEAMVLLRLRQPLKSRAGDRAEHLVEGDTVIELLRKLEGENPGLAGWILDEQGAVRRHINVYVNGERAGEDADVGPDDRVDVLPAISGG